MKMYAMVELAWKRTPSLDVNRIRIEINNDGVSSSQEFGVEVESHSVKVYASKMLTYKIVSIDEDNNEAVSQLHSFTLSDLESPLPATELTHKIVSIHDEDLEPGPTPVPMERKAKK